MESLAFICAMNRVTVLSVPDVSKEQPERSFSWTHSSDIREPINRDAPSYPRGKGVFKHEMESSNIKWSLQTQNSLQKQNGVFKHKMDSSNTKWSLHTQNGVFIHKMESSNIKWSLQT